MPTKARKKPTRAQAKEHGAAPVKAGEFAAYVEAHDTDLARPYKISEVFEPDEAIMHSVFGLGFVRELKAGDKIDVLFEDCARLMVHSRPA